MLDFWGVNPSKCPSFPWNPPPNQRHISPSQATFPTFERVTFSPWSQKCQAHIFPGKPSWKFHRPRKCHRKSQSGRSFFNPVRSEVIITLLITGDFGPTLGKIGPKKCVSKSVFLKLEWQTWNGSCTHSRFCFNSHERFTHGFTHFSSP